MTAQCVRCARPLGDGTVVCLPDAQELADVLAVAAGHAEDVDAVITRQTRYGAGTRGQGGEGLTPNTRTTASYAAVANAIGGWASMAITETGRRPHWRPYLGPLCAPARPGDDERRGNRCEHDSCATVRRRIQPSTLAVDAAWLGQARQIQWLRRHPAADEAFTELHAACDQLARLVDRPADRELVGMCDCGRVLYAVHGRPYVTCPQPTCRLRWNVAESRDILRRGLRDKLVTAADAARLAAHWDDRTQEQIRKLVNAWASRGQVLAHGTIWREATDAERTAAAAADVDLGAGPVAEPTYRFGDVVDRLARTPRRAARETVEMGA